MIILQTAAAGTLESSDIMVTVMPDSEGVKIELESSVYQQYSESILKTIRDVTDGLGVTNVKIVAYDRGALDCTIRARVETALMRASERKVG